MARKNRTPEENARREKIRELLQMANIGSMDDIQNLFKETIAEFMENGLEAELDDELGYRPFSMNSAIVSLNRFWMSSMLPMFAICSSSRIFSLRTFSSGLRFFLDICKPPVWCFYFTPRRRFTQNWG